MIDSRPVRTNPVQFAVVREDPEIEKSVCRAARSVLLVASGGCTALTLQCARPDLEIALFDLNPAQLDLVRRKIDVLRSRVDLDRQFNVGADDPAGLNACGNFESLFRGFRRFLHEFVTPEPLAEVEAMLAHRYWPVAFDLFFSDALLNTMFTPAATQHAPPGSYPSYFRGVLERGLRRPDAGANYFLHHIFLGHYRLDSLPEYLRSPAPHGRFEWILGRIQDVPALDRFDVISLSNLFDWMSEGEVAEIAALLKARTRPGCRILFRQLNHAKDFQRFFRPEFAFDEAEAARLLALDRSLFYSKLSIGAR